MGFIEPLSLMAGSSWQWPIRHQRSVISDLPQQGTFPLFPYPCSLFSAYPQDSVADWIIVSKIVRVKSFVAQLEEVVRLPHRSPRPRSPIPQTVPTAHWPHMENFEEVNAYIRDWLTRNFHPEASNLGRAGDEL